MRVYDKSYLVPKEGTVRIPPPPKNGKKSLFSKGPSMEIYKDGNWVPIKNENKEDKNDMP